MDTCYYTFVKVYRMYTKSELYCKLWALGNMMCQYRFIAFNKCTTLVQDFDSKGSCVYVREGVYEKSVYLPLDFIEKIKLLQK